MRIDNLETNIRELLALKNTIRELHEVCTGFNSRIDQAEERISEVGDLLNEMKREDKIREQRVKRNEQSLQEIWDYVKRPNLRLIGVPECHEENESKLENIFQDIIQENFPNLVRQEPHLNHESSEQAGRCFTKRLLAENGITLQPLQLPQADPKQPHLHGKLPTGSMRQGSPDPGLQPGTGPWPVRNQATQQQVSSTPSKGFSLSLRLECSGVITAHCSLDFLGSSDCLTSASQTRFHHVGQVGLELPTSDDPPALASKVLGLQIHLLIRLCLIRRGFTMLVRLVLNSRPQEV
ncbi:LINE-1 retrotransposable element ORF1 protein [Plecturocebus cupreus]